MRYLTRVMTDLSNVPENKIKHMRSDSLYVNKYEKRGHPLDDILPV